MRAWIKARYHWLIILAVILGLVLVGAAIWPLEPAQHWLAVHTGTVNEPGEYYGFWSGFGSVMERLVELVVIGGLLLHRLNCHEKGCLRIGKYPAVEDGGWKYCRRHHKTHGEQP